MCKECENKQNPVELTDAELEQASGGYEGLKCNNCGIPLNDNPICPLGVCWDCYDSIYYNK